MGHGLTTGTCAASAAKAAAMLLISGNGPTTADVPLPDGGRASCPVFDLCLMNGGASASAAKEAGEDPDIIPASRVDVTLCLNGTTRTRFFAGPGVETFICPGPDLPAGDAVISPGPRQQIIDALNEVCRTGFDVTVKMPSDAGQFYAFIRPEAVAEVPAVPCINRLR